MGATWRDFGEGARKPRKQPVVVLSWVHGVRVMFCGTWERMTWPFTFRVDSESVKGEGLNPFTCFVTSEDGEEGEAFFMLGAILNLFECLSE